MIRSTSNFQAIHRSASALGEPQRETLKVHGRQCVLVAVRERDVNRDKDRVFDEMRGLVETAGSEIVGTLMQIRERPDPASYIGKGKLVELKEIIGATGADLIVFDNHLSPSQGKHIEETTKTQVVDRSEVILDIFATHARSYESKLQVELAQLLYMRPRLTRMWTHLERIEGGIGSGKGPGEKQLETDRRLVDKRISELKKKLETVEKRRELQVASRTDHKTISLVGYTNAGKSTLMNALTGADVYVANKLFATLDTRTRKWTLPHLGDVLLSDTVGFIRSLPHHLVASFKSTLAEARHADLLLHVVDASHPEAQQQIETVNQVLEEVGVDAADPILVLNKIDLAEDRSKVDILRAKFPNSVTISAFDGTGLDRLTRAVAERLAGDYLEVRIETDAGNGRVHSFLIEHADVLKTDYQESRVVYECRLPKRFVHTLEKVGAEVLTLDGLPLTRDDALAF
ncbi:GTPase HflX [Planctomicrobium sp. SH664]|uniref:GTPase HflX n=1 Tax=Planctomicrobium sp. SH664 TaxID=3448125 RepID=UPI003F5C212E